MFKKLKKFSGKYLEWILLAICSVYFVICFILTFIDNPTCRTIAASMVVLSMMVLALYLFFNISYKQLKGFKISKERTIDYYVKKYQYYVDLVESMLSKQQYKEITLDEGWVKEFDDQLHRLSKFQKDRKVNFSDNDIAACLMISIVLKAAPLKKYELAFECAKVIISQPKLYNVDYGPGDELLLTEYEVSAYKTDFSIPDDEISNQAMLAIVTSYLFLGVNIHYLAALSDFLHILCFRLYKP